jgi:biopolymer transport protein ExbD
MGMSGGKLDGEPMLDMNMTPLIDVLLVLLIMFIITIPIATHSVDIDLPQGTPPPSNVQIKPVKNKIVLTPQDQILWNGEEVTKANLISLLEDTRTMTPEPELQFEPFGLAGYEISAEVLQIIKLSKVNKFGFVGNEKYREFGKEEGS